MRTMMCVFLLPISYCTSPIAYCPFYYEQVSKSSAMAQERAPAFYRAAIPVFG